ncbi:MAG: hypothetical protein DI534_14825 [Leifsonia xyli]|nr:MAG: hypothetical protein DI534_14825 [Leifsonia xyli]
MVVKAIASDTALTITRPFSGPNVTGVNWAAIPAGTMVGVTAKIADDTAYTMRMYVNEANNWMSLLTIDGEVTVYAPDGSSYTGPSWLKLSHIMGTLDIPALTTIAAQIHADAVQVAADTQTTAANTATATQAAQTATTAAQSASQDAQTATTKAGEASASAITAKNEADRAATANPDNQLKKAENLNDLADKSTARKNINVQGVKCVTSTTPGDFNALSSPDDKLNLLIANNGTWGVQSTTGDIKPLLTERGGTGATNAAGARANLGALYKGGDTATNQMETKLSLATNPGGSILGHSWRSTIEAAYVGTSTADFFVNHTVGGVTYACIKPTRIDGTNWEFHFSDFGEISNISGLVVNRNTGTTGEASGNLSLSYGASMVSQYATRMDFADTSARAVLNIYDNTRLVTVAPTAGVICKKGYNGEVQPNSYSFSWENLGVDVYIDSNRMGRLTLDPTSDIDYKEDIQDWDGESALDNIDAMELVTFKFKADEKQRTRRGVIAQQIETIDPEYVHHSRDQNDKPILSLDTNVLLLDALAAIKVLSSRVKELEAKLESK